MINLELQRGIEAPKRRANGHWNIEEIFRDPVALTGVLTDEQYVSVSLTDVVAVDGGTGGSGSACFGFLVGDVNQNRVVSLADLGLVNARLAQVVTAITYLYDVNASGALTLADKAITNNSLTKSLPPP